MPTIFQTDQRLRNLVHTNATVHEAQQLALRDGDDLDALIVAVMALVQNNETLRIELQKYVEGTPRPIHMDATPELIERLQALGVLKPNEGEAK